MELTCFWNFRAYHLDMRQLHETQLQILKKLLFAAELRYAQIKPDPEMENNQFDFHLDQLVDGGYIAKKEKGYSLTNFGKEYANRMDTEEVLIAKQSKISAWVCCIREEKERKQYLIYTRLKQPFYGCQGFMSGKVKYGEKIIDAAKRELREETGLEGEPKIVNAKHFLVYDKETNGLVEDKFMYLCVVRNPTGELRPHVEGLYRWVDELDVKKFITNPFEPIGEFLKYLRQADGFDGQVTIEEIDHWSDKF